MTGITEYAVVLAVVGFAAAYLTRLFLTKKQKPGCSTGCACPKPAALKRK